MDANALAVSGQSAAVYFGTDDPSSGGNPIPCRWFRWQGQCEILRNCNIVSTPFCDIVSGVREPVILEFGGPWRVEWDPFVDENLNIGAEIEKVSFVVDFDNDVFFLTPFAIVEQFLVETDVDGLNVFTCSLKGNWTFKDTSE